MGVLPVRDVGDIKFHGGYLTPPFASSVCRKNEFGKFKSAINPPLFVRLIFVIRILNYAVIDFKIFRRNTALAGHTALAFTAPVPWEVFCLYLV